MCNYEHEFFDDIIKRIVVFECEDREVQDGLCIFHAPKYWQNNSHEVAQVFYKKWESATENDGDSQLLCIGYNLPNITLDHAKLQKPINFTAAKFHGIADFSRTTFTKAVAFRDATFAGKAVFLGTSFTETYFVGTEFISEVEFEFVTFGEADFNGAKFRKMSTFDKAKFTKVASFQNATFGDRVTFYETTFKEVHFVSATFSEARFYGNVLKVATFDHAKFKQASFVKLQRINEDSKVTRDPFLFFHRTEFKNPIKTYFDDFDLSNTCFIYTNVREIDINEQVEWVANEKTLSERLAEQHKVPFEVVATEYRRLRENLESKLRHVEAGRFFIAEMEVKRKNVKTKNRVFRWLRMNVFSVLAWYKYFSRYGESYRRVMIWIVLTPLIAAFLTSLTTISPSKLDQFNSVFQNCLQDYVFAFFQLKTDNLPQLGIRILSLLLIGQLYVALRRKFQRGFTKVSF